MGKHDDFIKISYCIFKIHKPFINYSMQSSYAKDLNSVSAKSNLYICILIFNEHVQAHKKFQVAHRN